MPRNYTIEMYRHHEDAPDWEVELAWTTTCTIDATTESVANVLDKQFLDFEVNEDHVSLDEQVNLKENGHFVVYFHARPFEPGMLYHAYFIPA